MTVAYVFWPCAVWDLQNLGFIIVPKSIQQITGSLCCPQFGKFHFIGPSKFKERNRHE